ncbi:neutral zinc metallopeptidase [Novosphingobium sp. 9]|uniref:KPN_02809 family neutral zinc metallopeptidase n=1 Tax=Novosphingobium sp. 9 TaxID=2025349 RepID=UPI0021B6B133|nr:neutral zinc metallopeptidase [Novosphingobium sp. 9]
MRLNQFNPANIRVSQGEGGGGGFPGGGGGKLGCGTLVLVLIGAVVFGVDPQQMLGTIESVQTATQGGSGGQSPTSSAPAAGTTDVTKICTQNAYATEACNALDSLNQTWQPRFQQAGIAFEQPMLYFYNGTSRSGCGVAQAAMGPFYCPADQGIWIDTSFYDELQQQLGAKGDFARYYVMAHEYGHHVQHLTGLDTKVRREQQANPQAANSLQVRMELQADCYAGVWAARNRDLIEPGDMEEGMRAASAIGDDTLMRNAGQAVNAERFTHGTSAQRMEWLKRGLDTGNEDACDTFAS